LELVDAIHEIVFGPGSARKDDRHAISTVQSPTDAPADTNVLWAKHEEEKAAAAIEHNRDMGGMYSRLTSSQLFALIDCLLESASFCQTIQWQSAATYTFMESWIQGSDETKFGASRDAIITSCIEDIVSYVYGQSTYT